VVPFALIGCFLSVFSTSLATILLTIAEKMLQALWPLLDYFSQIQHATMNASISSPIGLIIATLGMLWLLAPKGFPGRALGLICLTALFGSPKDIPHNAALITVLDVGQGLAVVVETAKHTLMFDTGPKLNDTVNAGNRVILPFLVTRNIRKIDTLIISHGDLDHIGGAADILKAYPVDNIMTSEPWLFEEAEHCKAGQHWEWDNVMFDMLHPNEIDEPYYRKNAKRNDQSCVLRIQAGNQSVLITGDIETKSEKSIIEYIELHENARNIVNKGEQISLKSTILLVPHHGSKSSSSEAFIDAVSPKYAVIPVGYRNTYGHPKKEIVQRYEQRGITVLDSVRGGAIQFLLNDKNEIPIPKQYRVEHKQYWSFSD
jgi:competence protein ComEC